MINKLLICLLFITTVSSEVWLWFEPSFESGVSLFVSFFALISFCHTLNNLKINRKKYLLNLAETFRNDNLLVDLKIVKQNSLDKELGEIKYYRIKEALSESKNIQVFGKPGSGKTSILRMLMYELSCDVLERKSKIIPVYLEFGKNDLFEKIKSEFHSKGFVADASKLSLDILKNMLNKDSFLILIDDVHKLNDPITKEETKIEELLHYSNNSFVLTSRDYYKRNVFGFDLFEMAKLGHEEVKKIFELYLDESEIGGINRGMLIHKGLSELYNTPQMLVMLAKVVKSYGRIPSNKAELFKQFILIKNNIELGKNIAIFETKMNHKILIMSHLAYFMFRNTDEKYIISINECIEVLHKCLQESIKRGFEETNGETFLNYLLKEGYLINYDGEIKFEHDQWQEYFAALYIVNNNISLKEINEHYSIREISYFVCGMFNLENRTEKEKLNKYLVELLDFDFYLVGNSLNNFENMNALDSVRETYTDFVVTDELLKNSFETYLNFYEKILKKHFPNLKKKFYPNTEGEIGIVVQRSKDKLSFWNGFYKITKSNNEKVVLIHNIFDDDKNTLPTEFRNHGVDLGLHAQYHEPIIYTLPIIGAYTEVMSQLKDIINSKELIETDEIERERLFHELRALKDKLYLSKKTEDVTVGELLNGFKKLKIEKEIFPQYVHHNSVDVISLKREVEKRFSENYSPVEEIKPTTYFGYFSHKVTDLDVEQKLKKFIEIEKLGLDDKVRPLFQTIPENINFYSRVKFSQLSKDEQLNILEWYADFYKKVYENYKTMIEINFRTIGKYFKTYNNMPIRLVILDNEQKHVYRNIEKQSECVKVQIMNKQIFDEFDKDAKFRKWFRGYWLKNLHARDEILRNAVYELIENEFKDFYKN